jgi:hypothetical protein
MDDDIDEALLARLKALLLSQPGQRFALVPYAVTPNFQRWAAALTEFGVSVFGESLEWTQRYGHKACSVTQLVQCWLAPVPVMHGCYVCTLCMFACIPVVFAVTCTSSLSVTGSTLYMP